jgi:N-acetylglucosamine malate deacetylase 1
MTSPALDILAIAAHRDDVEQTCGGTLLKAAKLGQRTGILDLTQGEMGTRGTAESRGKEAQRAAEILKARWRQALEIPDGRVENTYENRLKIARVIREQKPRVVILPYWLARHPDHYNCATVAYEACFLSGLKKLDVGGLPPYRPYKIVYASLYHDVRPTFVVDITDEFEARVDALFAYESQYADQESGSKLFPKRAEIRDRVAAMAGFYGLLAGVKYAEPFVQKEVGLVDDLLQIPVQSL